MIFSRKLPKKIEFWGDSGGKMFHLGEEKSPFTLHAHLDARWLHPAGWDPLSRAPADLPIIKHLPKTPPS